MHEQKVTLIIDQLIKLKTITVGDFERLTVVLRNGMEELTFNDVRWIEQLANAHIGKNPQTR